MTQGSDASSWWRDLLWLGAVAMTPGVLLLQHLDPCDSTVAIAAGSSMLHIGLILTLGLLTALGFVFQPIAAIDAPESNAKKRGYRQHQIFFAVACCVAVIWLALATTTVSGRGNVRFAVNGFWQWTSMLVWTASVGALATRPGFSRLAITAALALGVGVLVYGFWEYAVIQPELRRQLERDPVGLFRRQGISPESSAGLMLADRIRSTEMKGFYALANSLGGFLACYWILAIGLLASRRSRSLSAFHIIILIAIAVGLLLTKSRTAWLASGGGTAFLLVVTGIFSGRIRKRMLGLGLVIGSAIAGLGILVVYLFDPLILQEAGKSLAYRFDYWRGAIVLIFREPWVGYGVGGFQSTYLHVKLPTAAESPADPHNFLLEAAHAGGLPYLLAVSIAIGMAMWLVCSRAKAAPLPLEANPVNRRLTIFFWSGAVLSALSLVTWSVLTDSDERLYGILVSLAAFAGSAVLWSRWPDASTSVQLLVKNNAACGAAFAVILVHFLASGGWLLPGTMSLGMFVIALGIASPDDTTVAVLRPKAIYPSRMPRKHLGVVAVAALLLVVWYATMAVPMLRGTEILGKVLGGPLSNPSRDQLRTLLIADRWDPEIARIGMEWTAEHFSQPMSQGARGEWEGILREFQMNLQERDPQNALAWDASGQASTRVAALTVDLASREEWLGRADQAFEQASKLSPASAQAHIQAALSAHWLGDRARCQKHCKEAENIDAATRHRDRKIAAAQVVWPAPLVPREVALGENARRGLPRDSVRAEPVLRFLRSQN